MADGAAVLKTESQPRVRRDAFGYLEPAPGDETDFAQCATCCFYHHELKGCELLYPRDHIEPTMSCIEYVPGVGTKVPPRSILTPEEVGLVDRPVRCENCAFFNDGICGLYVKLTTENPETFALGSAVHPQGCCNAHEPKLAKYNDNHDEHGRFASGEGHTLKDENTTTEGRRVWWHGSPSGDLRGSGNGLHLGTKAAATQALEARIGIPADGKGWTGDRVYGDTLLAGSKSIESGKFGQYRDSGFNSSLPEEDFYPRDYLAAHPEKQPTYGSNEKIPLSVKPSVEPYVINWGMTNSPSTPHEDAKANGYMQAAITRGSAKHGYYYRNDAEDSGSISAVVPNGDHLEHVSHGVTKAVKTKWRKLPATEFDEDKYAKELAAYQSAIHGMLVRLKAQVIPQVRAKLADHVGKLAKANPVSVEVLDPDIFAEDVADSINLSDLQTVVSEINRIGASVAGDSASIAIGHFGFADNSDIVNQADHRAADWARFRAAELVGMHYDADGNLVPYDDATQAIDDSTRRMIQRIIADGLDEGATLDDIVDDLEEAYPFSEDRAAIIASTEVRHAHSAGMHAAAEEAEDNDVMVRKYWGIVDDEKTCDDCLDNADDGALELDDAFATGDTEPPAHASCRCYLGLLAGDAADSANQDDSEDDIEDAARIDDLAKYNADQARDEHGRWTSGGDSMSKALDSAVSDMAHRIFPGGYDTSPNAPNTFNDLVKDFNDRGRMTVFSGASDKTIFGSEKANYDFRAWHDSVHLRLMAPFTPDGEHRVCEEQQRDLKRAYGDTPKVREMCSLIQEEIDGQVGYAQHHNGDFPVNQRAFATAYLKNKEEAIRADFSKRAKGWGQLRDSEAGITDAEFRPSVLAHHVAAMLRGAMMKFDESEHPRDAHGKFTAGGVEFVSPNVGNLDFNGAVQALGDTRQQMFMQAAHDIDHEMNLDAHTGSVIGVWSDGAENSTITEAHNVSMDELRANAAMKGYLADQKAVLVFKNDQSGSSVLYDFHTKGDLGSIRQQLADGGIQFFTLVPEHDGARVYVADIDGSARENVGKFAEGKGIDVHWRSGNAEFIGTEKQDGTDREQRDDARVAYEKVLQGSAYGPVWQRVRDRWSQQLAAAKLAKYSEDQPRDEHGKWTTGPGGGETWQHMAEAAKASVLAEHPRYKDTPLAHNLDQVMRDTEQNQNWRDWYARHVGLARDLFGKDEPTFERFLAVTSINASPQQNMDRAIAAFEHWKEGGNFKTAEDFPHITAGIRMGLQRVVDGEPTEGLKVAAFEKALLGDWSQVPTDRHMARILFEPSKTLENANGLPDRYHEVTKAIVTAYANNLGWKASELQAALWVTSLHYQNREPSDFAQYLKVRADAVRAWKASLNKSDVEHPFDHLANAFENAAILMQGFALIRAMFDGHPTLEGVEDLLNHGIVSKAFNEDQPRDDHGRWSGSGGDHTESGDWHGAKLGNPDDSTKKNLFGDAGFGFHGADQTFTAAGKQVVDAVHSEVQKLAERTGNSDIANGITFMVRDLATFDPAHLSGQSIPGDIVRDRGMTERPIVYNTNLITNDKPYNEANPTDVYGAKYFVIGKGDDFTNRVIRHEIGHALTEDSDLNNFAMLKQYDSVTTNVALRENCGQYSLSNQYEALAELFSVRWAPDYVKGSLPRNLEMIPEQMAERHR